MSELRDPRVLFAAERTLFAWNRTGISLMAFGFVIERFGLYLQLLGTVQDHALQRQMSFLGGLGFILLGAFLAIYSALQYKRILVTLHPAEIPQGYDTRTSMVVNLLVGGMGVMLCLYLTLGVF